MESENMTTFTDEEIAALKTDLNSKLNEFRAKNEIKSGEALDVVSLLNKIGFTVYLSDNLYPYEGVLLVDESKDKMKAFPTDKVVILSEDLSVEDRNFTAAHELAHYLCAKWTETKPITIETRERHNDSHRRSPSESFMDFIAACLLVPEEEFKALLKGFGINGIDTAKKDIVEFLAKYYNVSIDTIEKRIEEVLN